MMGAHGFCRSFVGWVPRLEPANKNHRQSPINQYVARRLLEENIAKEIVKENIKLLKENLRIVKEFTEKNGWEISEPKGGIYAFIRLPGIDSVEFSLKLLRYEKVAVAPGADFGDCWKDWLRITIAKSKSELLEGLRRIEKQYNLTTCTKPRG